MLPSYLVLVGIVGMLMSQSMKVQEPSLWRNLTCKATPILVMVREGLVYSWQLQVLS